MIPRRIVRGRSRKITGGGSPSPAPPPAGGSYAAIPAAGKMYFGGDADWRDYFPCPFVDIVKASRWFGDWDQFGDNPSQSRDAQGWPLVQCEITLAARTFGNAGGFNSEPVTGTYKGFYKLQSGAVTMSTVGLSGCSVTTPVFNATSGEYEFDLVVTGNMQATLRFTGGIKDLRIITAGYSTTNPPLLRTEFLNYYKRFHSLRFINPLDVNDGEIGSGYDTSFAARRPPAHPKSFESICAFITEVANASNSKLRNVQLPMNIQFSPADITQIAAIFRDNVPSTVSFSPEGSNECWNFFYGAKWSWLMAIVNDTNHPDYAWLAQQGGDQWDRMARLWCLLAARMAIAWETAIGVGSIGQRLRPVISSQFANSGWIGRMDTFMKSSQFTTTFRPAGQLFYELSTAPYLGGSTAEMDAATTVAAMLAGLTNGFEGSLAAQTAGNVNTLSYSAWEAYRVSLGISTLACYEGQLHLHGSNNVPVKLATKSDPGAKTLLLSYFQALANAGFKQFRYLWVTPVPYNDTDVNSGWAAAQSATDNSSSIQAMDEKIAEYAL